MGSNTTPLLLEDITRVVIGVFFAVYNELSGFPEFILRRALVVALREAGVQVEEEVPLPVWFRGRQLSTFRADLIVNQCLIVEVKASTDIQAFHKAQLSHYLKATDLEVGLLLNFGRRPEFSRVIYEKARKQSRNEPGPAHDSELDPQSSSPDERGARKVRRFRDRDSDRFE
jgi:GxxExxY protein